MISVDGGTNPRWRQDGKELLYARQDDRSLMAVEIKTTANTIEPGTPKRLFQYPIGNPNFGMTPDADRFLWTIIPGASGQPGSAADSPITVVLNWTALIKK